MRHIIDAIAAQGRGDDSELLHVTKGELAGLDNLARRHFGRELPRNPRTGIKEASLFRDWFGNDVGQVLDVAAPVATAFIPGVGPVAAAAMGAGLGAANQGLGKGGTTESALMGGVMGGIGAYGGSGLAEGLAGASSAAAPTGGLTGATTPIGEAGANLGGTAFTAPAGESTMNIADAGNLLKPSTGGATGLQAPPTAMQNVAPTIRGGAAPVTPAPAPVAGEVNLTIPEGGVKSLGGETGGTNWNYLTTKDALGPATQIGTSAIGTMSMPGAPTDTTSSGATPANKTLPKAEVYYTPYGERRTRIAAAEGGLMSVGGVAAYGDYDGAEDMQGVRNYAGGGGIGFIQSIQPGGEFGDISADMYGAVQEHKPEWLQKAEPGGFIGATVPGKLDWEAKQRAEQDAKDQEARDAVAAQAAKDKLAQQAAFQQQWQDRYNQKFAQGGIASFGQGRYLQGSGDGMSDSIKANIDGKQEARLATGEFVVPADVVSGLGNGDSNSGAKQLHDMMDRTRQARTGTKKQGKQINPRKVMPV